jgi:hypothetical protein
MTYKPVLGMILLLCVTETIQAGRIKLGSGYLESSSRLRESDFYYKVPHCVYHVALDKLDGSSRGLRIRNIFGKVTVSWKRGDKYAKVHARMKPKWYYSRRISWTVWGWTK